MLLAASIINHYFKNGKLAKIERRTLVDKFKQKRRQRLQSIQLLVFYIFNYIFGTKVYGKVIKIAP